VCVADPNRNLSRKEFFQIFAEAVVISNERIQAGCELLPTPADLFAVEQDVEGEEISFPAVSDVDSSDFSGGADGASYVAVGVDESTEIFKLPKAPPKCYKCKINNHGRTFHLSSPSR
jgi:hypothetical protein